MKTQQHQDSSEQPKITTPKQLYEALEKEHPQEIKDQMKLFHLTPEMMTDPDFTISKYLKYVVQNDIKLPKEQMQQVLTLSKLEEQYRTNALQNGMQWISRTNIKSVKTGNSPEWRSRTPDMTMSANIDNVNKSYHQLGDGFSQYQEGKDEWLVNYKAREQIKAVADTLNIKIDIEKLVKSERNLIEILSSDITRNPPAKIIKEIFEAIVRNADDHVKAAKEIAKQGSDDIARAAVDYAVTNIDNAIHVAKDHFSHFGASVQGYASSSDYGNNFMHTVSALDIAAIVIPVSLALKSVNANHSLNKISKNVDDTLMVCNRIDLKVAMDYAKQIKGNTLPFLDSKQEIALNNLTETTTRNGGVKIFTQKIIRNIGTAGGVLGGPGGGLGVLGIMKTMEDNDRIPTPNEVSSSWENANLASAGINSAICFLFPPALLFTVPAVISGNIAMKVLKERVAEWHEKLNTPNGRANFLYELGERAIELQKSAPKELSDEKNLKSYQLKLAETAATRVATGYRHHGANDIMVLSQFANSVDSWFPEQENENLVDTYRRESAKKLAYTIKQAGILSNKNDLIEIARQAEKEGLSR